MRRLFLVVLFSAVAAAAQTTPSFEVASVKPSQPGQRGRSINLPPPGREVTAQNVPLSTLILVAYHLQEYQLSGGPKWLDDDTFDIAAKSEQDATREQYRLMLRKLLADRFKLEVREESKEGAVYELVVAKGGSKMPESQEKNGFRWGGGRINGHGTAKDLAEILSSVLDHPVTDRTGLTANYNVQMQWTPERFQPKALGPGVPSSNEPGPSSDGPSLFTAIQEQLGLKLEARKGPIPMLVIVSASKPSAN